MGYSVIRNILPVIFFSLFFSSVVCSQTSVAAIKHKKCLLKGKWQLVQTFTDSAVHPVPKEEYDAVVCFKPFHKYTEEVTYEGYHWLIAGKWQVFKHKATLAITKRQYVFGKLGDVPQDILFELSALNKNNWAGNTTAENKPVSLFYSRIKKR